MSGVTIDSLLTAVRDALSRVDDREESVAIVQPRRITIEGQISRLRQRAKTGVAFGFTELLSAKTSRVEISITLLAVLELIKRREILASQTELFGPIELRANPENTAAQTAVA